MSYSIVLFSNLVFHVLEIIWTLKIFNNFSSWEILIFQIVELIFVISQIGKFDKILNYNILINFYIIS